ncbi:hypothetical protein ISF6_3593 [Piscinibacter sakaiensis]|uniref:Uncharacterized protein n=1 Tax=Piscinibacter sakaiensis TaxID=1547922 RepID=A0A0K8P4R8_PISS1|nr:hypothetical protein ISF6_3593 [Piscinibacter sakaiensis]
MAHRRAELLHRRRGLLQRAGLFLRAARQVLVALRDLRAGRGHALGVLAHPRHHLGQALAHALEAGHQAGLVTGPGADRAAEVPGGHPLGRRDGLGRLRAELGEQAARQHGAQPGREQAQRQAAQGQRQRGGRCGGLQRLGTGGEQAGLGLRELGHAGAEGVHRGLVAARAELLQQRLGRDLAGAGIAPQRDQTADHLGEAALLGGQLVQPRELRAVVLHQRLQQHDVLVEVLLALAQRLEEGLVAAGDEAAHARLHVDHAQQQLLGLRQHLVGVGVPFHRVEQAGVVDERDGDQRAGEREDGGKRGDEPLLECPVRKHRGTPAVEAGRAGRKGGLGHVAGPRSCPRLSAAGGKTLSEVGLLTTIKSRPSLAADMRPVTPRHRAG